jgi:hypothetical protein
MKQVQLKIEIDMKTLGIIHWIVEVVVLTIIACAAGAIAIMDLRVLGGLTGTLYTIAQLIVVLMCIPGGLQVKKGIDWIFGRIEDIMIEEKEA